MCIYLGTTGKNPQNIKASRKKVIMFSNSSPSFVEAYNNIIFV
jgi:hypothetical protein